MKQMWEPLAPHYNIFLADKPMEISGNIAIPKPVVSTMSAWMADAANDEVDPAKLSLMIAMFA